MAIFFAVCMGNAGADNVARRHGDRCRSERDCRRHPDDRRGDKHTCFAFCGDTIIVPGLTGETTTTTGGSGR